MAVAASAGFLLGLGSQTINWAWVLALLGGGLIAAWLVRSLTRRLLGTGVGLILVLANGNTIAAELGASTAGVMQGAYTGLAAATLLAAVWLAARRNRLTRSAAEPA